VRGVKNSRPFQLRGKNGLTEAGYKNMLAHRQANSIFQNRKESKVANANEPEHARVDNLRIWSDWSTDTPKEALKQFNRKGFRGTAIDPTYRFERLTQLFGPNGQGWGFHISKQWREDFEGVPVVFVQGFLWYLDPKDGKRCETSEQIGGTVAIRTPDEAYKMSITDATTKCCQLLGLAADVYKGSQDGSKYFVGDEQPTETRDQRLERERHAREEKARKAEAEAKANAKPTEPPAQQAIDAMLANVNAATTPAQMKPIADWFRQHRETLNAATVEIFVALFKMKATQFETPAAEGSENG